jgi:hypothetical protein
VLVLAAAGCGTVGGGPACASLLVCCSQIGNLGQRQTCQELHTQATHSPDADNACAQIALSFNSAGECTALPPPGDGGGFDFIVGGDRPNGSDGGGPTDIPLGVDPPFFDAPFDAGGPDLVPPEDVPVGQDLTSCSTDSCSIDSDCCNGLQCKSGFCEAPCADFGQSCQSVSDCCAGISFCSAQGICSNQSTCQDLGASCFTSTDCCSSFCDGSQCISTCQGEGTSCEVGANCCSGVCDASTCVPACQPSGFACNFTSDCCSGTCVSGSCSP